MSKPINPKYRNLTSEELKPLEKEFIDYLIVNGIVAEDWVNIKQEEPKKAQDIITLFSDVIFEGILRKTQFLEFRSKHDLMAFHCLRDKIILVGVKSDSDDIDFTDKDAFGPEYIKSGTLKIYSQEKAYNQTREKEIFDMIQNGSVISDGRLYKALQLAMVDNS